MTPQTSSAKNSMQTCINLDNSNSAFPRKFCPVVGKTESSVSGQHRLSVNHRFPVTHA